jgi:PelA/Pel-15E family pectate lyase
MGMLIGLLAVPQGSVALGAIGWGEEILEQQPEWYGSAEARAAADNVLIYQSELGAWPKNWNLLAPIATEDLEKLNKSTEANTIDNGATTLPMRFLALVHQASPDEKYRAAFTRGVNYLLDSQYPNGGFPQFFPLRGNKYYSRITYNDGAMVRALELLRDVARGQVPYDLVDDELRAKVAASVKLGIDCILKTQIKQDGKPTVWCAQHDEKTLEPAWARAYEPPSLSGSESVGIVRFLMSIEEPTPEIIAAIESAVAWFHSVAIKGVRQERIRRDDGRTERLLVPDPAAPPLWERFYELGTNRPLYLDRDSVFRYDYAEISYERRSGYTYNGTWAASLLATKYPAWRKRHKLP